MTHPTDAIFGDTPQIAALRAQIRRLVTFDAPGNPHVPTVLLQGETGTGKGLVARIIHDSGPRARNPFVDVNCAAIPEAMLEAELFGFEAGAFTDAKRVKPGLFEAASGGTLFLDEIDSLPLVLQGKVLKAIEEKRVRRLGAVEPRDVDVKLVTATQRDLAALVDQGGFRADLFHRLAVLVIVIPPLRERSGDVLVLAERFLRSYAEAHGLAPKHLDEAARQWLIAHLWPGNVRELGHLMERVTLLSPEENVGRDTLEGLGAGRGAPQPAHARPAAARAADAAPSEPGSADEEDRIRAALERSGGNVVRAAKRLGIGRNALRYRMRRLGVERPDLDDAPATRARPVTAGPVQSIAAPTHPPDTTPSWEQKTAAVLAISLSFPASVESVGYEPWTAAMRWNRTIAEQVEGFGGFIMQRSPSQVTAVFGVPRALEQTPQRAVQAALAIRRAVAQATPPRPDMRAAIHLGEVRIDTAAADPLARLFPIGETFALSERLLGHTGSGEVLVSPPVARRVESAFELHARGLQLGPTPQDRLTAHAVARQQAVPVASRFGDAAATAFIGRQHERDLLRDAFSRAQSGRGHVVFLVGEAGIGKSRLLAELRLHLGGTPHRWIEGQCASYGATTPFLPIIDGLRRYLGIDDHDDETSATAKVEGELARLGSEVAWTLPYLKQLLSLAVSDASVRALDSASRRSELFRALRALVLRAAELEPLVLVIEDLHWIDPASEEFIAFVADAIPTTPVLLLLSHRPGYVHPFRDQSYHVRVALAPLTGNETATMTRAILGTREIPEALRVLITDKAEGNPFFVEELAKSLLEEGVVQRTNGQVVLARDLDDLAIPDTIQDVLIARIDRLAEKSRRAIQVASVIGREFALRLLARISEAGEHIQTHVEELRSLELIYEKALHPELAYMFKHALTHDVAYESVVVERRKFLHSTIGLAIEELYADRLGEHYETLALHFERGEDWERAMRYHELSADKAAETYANRAVVDHCRQALAIAERLGTAVSDEVRSRVNERLGRACFYLSEFVASAAAFEEAAARTGNTEGRCLLLSAASYSHIWAHRYEPTLRCLDAAHDLSRRHSIPVGQARALLMQGFYRGVHDSDLDSYERCSEEALAICARHRAEPVEALAGFQLMQVAEWTGAYARAASLGEKTLALVRRLRMPELMIFVAWFLGKARCCLGDYGAAITELEAAYELCDRIGDRVWKSRLLNTLGWCFAEIGAIDRARLSNERAGALAREIGDPEILANADINLAGNHLAQGHIDRALSHLEPIEAALARPGDPWMRWRYSLHVSDLRGRLELARGEPERALVAADDEIGAARRHRAPKIEARALFLRGSSLLALDRRDEAGAALRDAVVIAERIGYQRGIWQAYRGLAEAARRSGETAAAMAHASRAQSVAEHAARSLGDGALRRQLIATAVDQEKLQ